MSIGGFQKNTLIDYPGKVSCIIFLFNCNFHCPYCHNPGLVTGGQKIPDYLSEEWIFDFLEKRRGLLDGVVITGGEPTLYSLLPDMCQKIKTMGYDIKLDTNGTRPEVIQTLIHEKLIDYCAMDIKTAPEMYFPDFSRHPVSDHILKTVDIIKTAGIGYEFRTTCVHPFINEKIVHTISNIIQGAERYVLQRFHNTQLLNPGFFDDTPPFIDDNQLNILKNIVSPLVRECIIR